MIEPGGALIDHTLLATAAKLLDGEPRREVDAGHLLSLSVFLDAVALQDKLYVLPAVLPTDERARALRDWLTSRGLLASLDARDYTKVLVANISGLLTSSTSRMAPEAVEQAIEACRVQLADKRPALPASLDEVMANLDHRGEPLGERPLSLAELGAEIVDKVDYLYSGAGERGVSLIRTFVYWRLYCLLGAPFYPSWQRMAQLERLAATTKASLTEGVYRALAAAFATQIEEVYDGEEQVPVSLPPTLALFLDHARGGTSLPDALAGLRDDFAEVRAALRAQEARLATATSLKERLAVKRQLSELLAAVKKRFEGYKDRHLDEILETAEEATEVFTAPTDPTRYSRGLLRRPADWMRRWWLTRRLRPVFDLSKRLDSIQLYGNLVHEVLGAPMTDGAAFAERYAQYWRLPAT